jgi:hypothetical protein
MVLGVDPRRRRVVNKIVTGPTSSNGSLALERLLWAATDSGVVAVDPRRSRVVARVPVPRAQGIAVDNSAVWIYAPRGLYSVDAGIATRRFAPPAPAFGAVAARQGRIWISDSVTRTLWRVGP